METEEWRPAKHGRVFREKFSSVYVVKGVWSLLKYLFFIRQRLSVKIQNLALAAGAILEIGLRVGVIPLNATPRHVLQTIFLFKELYLL